MFTPFQYVRMLDESRAESKSAATLRAWLLPTVDWSGLTTAEAAQLLNIEETEINAGTWSWLAVLDQGLTKSSNVAFTHLLVGYTGNHPVTGVVTSPTYDGVTALGLRIVPNAAGKLGFYNKAPASQPAAASTASVAHDLAEAASGAWNDLNTALADVETKMGTLRDRINGLIDKFQVSGLLA